MRQRISIQKPPAGVFVPGTEVYFRVSANPASAQVSVYSDAGDLLVQPVLLASGQEMLGVRLDPGEVWIHATGAAPWLEVIGGSSGTSGSLVNRPVAGVGNRGQFYNAEGAGDDGEDLLFVCMRSTTGAYTWRIVATMFGA